MLAKSGKRAMRTEISIEATADNSTISRNNNNVRNKDNAMPSSSNGNHVPKDFILFTNSETKPQMMSVPKFGMQQPYGHVSSMK